jgi:hypothetical protein
MATLPIRGNSNRENPQTAPHQVEDAYQEGGLLLLIISPSKLLFGVLLRFCAIIIDCALN